MTSQLPIYQESVEIKEEKRPLKPSKKVINNDSPIPPSLSPSESSLNSNENALMQENQRIHKKKKKSNNQINMSNEIEIAIDNNHNNDDIVIIYDRNPNFYKRSISILDIYDKHYSLFIHTWQPFKIIDFLLLFPTFLFSFIGIFIVTLVYAYFLHTLSYFIYALITLIISETLKCIFHRPRPNPATFEGIHRLINLSGILIARSSTSMPSGDTMQSAVLIICLRYVSETFSYWWLFLIPLVGFGRVYFQKHYIGDVLVGGVLGIVIGFVLNITLNKVINELHV